MLILKNIPFVLTILPADYRVKTKESKNAWKIPGLCWNTKKKTSEDLVV